MIHSERYYHLNKVAIAHILFLSPFLDLELTPDHMFVIQKQKETL